MSSTVIAWNAIHEKSPAADDEAQVPTLAHTAAPLPGTDIDMDKGTGDEVDGSAPQELVDIPMKYRIGAFAFIVFFSTGAAFTDVALGPLKTTLLKELNINNAQFSTISAATNVANTIFPIIGGIGMDYVGAVYAALVACFFCMLGSAIAAVAANTSNVSLLIAGRIIMGFGSIVIETSQNKLYAHWFTGSSLATVVALDLAWNSVTSIMARSAAVPMSMLNGWYGWALWIPSFTTMGCTLIVVGYWFYERAIPQAYRPRNGSDVRVKFGKKFAVRNMLRLPMFFWIICGTELFQNSARTVYSVNVVDIQFRTRGTTTLAAGFNASLQNVVTIVMVPLIGIFFDRYGWRMPWVSFGAAVYMVVFALIGLTTVHPLIPIVLSSFALAMNVIPFIGSIPILINDESLMGTAYGVWSAFVSVWKKTLSEIACNNIILEIATGAIQDRTPGQTYDRVIYFLIAIKAFQFLLGPLYDYLDGRLLGHSLRLNEKKRLALRAEKASIGESFKGWEVRKWTTAVFGGQLVAMILVSWIVSAPFAELRDLPAVHGRGQSAMN